MLEAMIRCCAGLDVHRRQVVCTVIREGSHETREYAAFYRELKELARWLQREQVELAVMESTGIFWKAVYASLEEAGIEGRVVNARHVKQVPGRKTDVQDSEWLAELGRCGLLRPSFIPPRDFRELRLLTRYRRKLSGILAGEKNRLHKVLDDAGIRLGCVVSDIDGVSARAMVEALIRGGSTPEQIAEQALGRLQKKKDALQLALEGEISDRHRLVLQKILGHIKWLQRQMALIDGQIVAAMKPYEEEWKLLQTIPGLDVLSAAVLLAEIGVDMSRFGSKDRLCSWAGMCPGNQESAGKRKSGRTRKANVYVRSILCEAANSARKTQSQFQGLYKGLVIRRGHKRAIVAVGHKILQVVYVLLHRKEPYKDPEIDYEALVVRRNAPRWLDALHKYGYLHGMRSTAGR
ncbi:MAG: IS110 family transposase [Syntrophobacteraceae bacterium]|nr:IS110 family transposase [Syntrophobacteraceae bacterium]